ncbi:MAG: zinc ribbon domain-containing protein [Acidimicrobiales bacterium]|jgi:RNA polymerase subunit RPABC4/transcription elongation factor Spt4
MSESEQMPMPLPMLTTRRCPFCEEVVPDSRYCGACGAHLAHGESRGSRRLHSYAAFPDEPVLRLSIASSLFPHLSYRGRVPFRAALGIIVSLLVVFSLAGTAAPLIAVCALGVPLLFLLYIVEVDPYEGTFVLSSAVALLLGAGLGVGWALIASPYVDQALQPIPSASLTSGHALLAAVVVPAVALVLMCVPLVAVRMMQRGRLESLDGFVAGATSALGFSLAATVVLWSPLLGNGQLLHQSFLANLSQAVERGLSLPLISAMSTGLIGAAVWVTRRDSKPARGRWLTSPVLALLIAAALQIGWAFGNLAALPDADVLVIQLAAIGLLTVLMRLGIHHVLIHEALESRIGAPRVCAHCSHLVPTMSFCPQCGVAERAIARPRRGMPVTQSAPPSPSNDAASAPEPGTSGAPAAPPEAPWPTAPPGAPGTQTGFPEVHEKAQHGHRVSHAATLALFAAGLAVLTVILVVVAVIAPAPPPAPCPPLGCQAPPIGAVGTQSETGSRAASEVAQGRLYTNSQGFTVHLYPFPGTTIYPGVSTAADGITLSFPFKSSYGGTSDLAVVGEPDAGATPQQIVNDEVSQIAPNAQVQFQMPEAYVGYWPGYGEAFETQVPNADGHSATYELVVMAAVRGGFGIAVVASGELLSRVTPGSTWWDGHPSPAAISVAYLGDGTVNSITFPRTASP